MPKEEYVQYAPMSKKMRVLHGALLSIVSAMNRPQQDDALIQEAGIQLDRALFPLLVGIERLGPLGVVELADRMGRDYTTVSRQVAKLAELGLVDRQPSPADRRVKMATITAKGRVMTDRLDRARERIASVIFQAWPDQEVDDLVRLMRKFANGLESHSALSKDQVPRDGGQVGLPSPSQAQPGDSGAEDV